MTCLGSQIFNLKKTQLNYHNILDNLTQEDIFYILLGYYPQTNKFYLSPFRIDRTPGCRFEKIGNWLYFIDNEGINGKIKFNCFETAAMLWQCELSETYNRLYNSKVLNHNFKLLKTKIPFRSEIKIDIEEWKDDDYFSQFDIPIDFLIRSNVFKVTNYYCNNRDNLRLIKNKYGKKDVMIAYYFPESNHIKLYFPYEIKEKKWISNCDENDVFNWSVKDEIENDKCIITKSGKDALILQHHLQIPTIALLNETVSVPDKVMDWIKSKKEIDIIYDNDSPGRAGANKIKLQIDERSNTRCKTVEFRGGKDAAEFYLNNGQLFY